MNPEFKPIWEWDYYRAQWEHIASDFDEPEDFARVQIAVDGGVNTNWLNITPEQAKCILAYLSEQNRES